MIKEIDLETYNIFLDSIMTRYEDYYEEEELEDETETDLFDLSSKEIYYGIFDEIGILKSTVCLNKIDYNNEYYLPYKFLENYIDYLINFVNCNYDDISYSRKLLFYLLDKYNNKIMLCNYDNLPYDAIEDIFVYNKIMSPYADIVRFEKYKDNYISFEYNNNYFLPYNFSYDLSYLYNLYYQQEMKKVDISRFKFKLLDSTDLYNLIYNNKTYRYNIPLVSDSGHSKFLGFHYFTPQDIVLYSNNNNNLKFLCCFSNNDYLLGVIKVANYDFTDDKYYLGLNYIDVHKSFRNLGIAKALYKFLDTCYSPDTILISSSLSEMGKLCNLDEVRKNNIKNFKNFNNETEAYDFIYKFLPTYNYLENADNLRVYRLFNFLKNNNCLENGKYKIENVVLSDKYYLKVSFKESSYYISSDKIYDITNSKYLFTRSKSNDFIPVKCFLDYIETLEQCDLKNFLKYISIPITICFDLKRSL